MPIDIKEADEIYRVSRWSDGYYQIGSNGNLHVCCDQEKGESEENSGG